MSERQPTVSPVETAAVSVTDPIMSDSAPTSILIDGRYITDKYPGIGRYVFNLVRALAIVDPEQHLSLLVGRGEQQTRFDLAALEECGVTLVPIQTQLRPLLGQLGIRRICRRLSPSLFHAPHIMSAGRVSCPSLVTIHDLIPIWGPGAFTSVRHRLVFKVILRRALGSTSRVITPSRAVSRDLQRLCGLTSERITVAPNAADPIFEPAPDEKIASVRERLGLPERYVLCVSTNRPHKNLLRLVKAWASLPDHRRNGCRLVIAGPEDARYPQARQQANALNPGAILFTGKIDEADLATVYSAARLVVQPSLCEGFGLPVIEAMACRAPVACSRTSTFDEVSGGAALKFDPTDVTEMSAAIDRALNEEDLREQLMSRGFARANELTWEQAAHLTLGAYRNILHQHETMEHGS